MFANKSNDAFDLSSPVLRDTCLRDYQYYSYDARVPNQPGRYELQVQDTSRYFLPALAFIEVEGSLTRADIHNPHDVNSQVGLLTTV